MAYFPNKNRKFASHRAATKNITAKKNLPPALLEVTENTEPMLRCFEPAFVNSGEVKQEVTELILHFLLRILRMLYRCFPRHQHHLQLENSAESAPWPP